MSSVALDLCQLFARSVTRTPHQLAVDHGSGPLTYTELDVASSDLARKIQQEGVVAGEAVLLLAEHGTRNIVALLAILKAHACYVPLDRSSWSSERIQSVLNGTDSRLLINTAEEPFESSRHKVIHLTSADVGCSRRHLVRHVVASSQEYGLSQHQLVCATVAQTLQWLAGSNDVVLGSPWSKN